MGIAVVTNDGFAAGALPDPESDFDQDWYYWTRRSLMDREGSQLNWEIDLHSMRRLRGGYKLVFISQTPTNENITELHANFRNLWSQEA